MGKVSPWQCGDECRMLCALGIDDQPILGTPQSEMEDTHTAEQLLPISGSGQREPAVQLRSLYRN